MKMPGIGTLVALVPSRFGHQTLVLLLHVCCSCEVMLLFVTARRGAKLNGKEVAPVGCMFAASLPLSSANTCSLRWSAQAGILLWHVV